MALAAAALQASTSRQAMTVERDRQRELDGLEEAAYQTGAGPRV